MIFSKLLLLAMAGGLSVAADSQEPCQKITEIRDKATKTNASAIEDLTFPGRLAYDCLQSIPFNSHDGTVFVKELRKWLQFHTTIDALKDPPKGYPGPPVDVYAKLDEMQSNATKSTYSSQFEFDQALESLLRSVHDQHLRADTCSRAIFAFHVDFPLVSVSSDGLELPQVYSRDDAALLSTHPGRISHISTINGEKAQSFFYKHALRSTEQDPDARYNSLFSSPHKFLQMGWGQDTGSWEYLDGLWPGSEEFKIGFANGTTTKVPTVAQFANPGSPFSAKDGKSLKKVFCGSSKERMAAVRSQRATLFTPLPTSAGHSTTAAPTPSSVSAVPSVASSSSSSAALNTPISNAFPTPVLRTKEDESLSGYYLKSKQVAVLNLVNFQPMNSKDFSEKATRFVKEAKAAGMKKLIIDLTFNSGGTTDVGFDLFKLFFPNKEMFTATRFRAHEAAGLIGQALGRVSSVPGYAPSFSTFTVKNLVSPHQKSFSTWSEIFGPHKELGTNVSSLVSPANFTTESIKSGAIRGYGPVKQNETEPAFAAEDILLVSNGHCGSTCTIFSEMMKNLAGVKSMVFGGRPQTGKMQHLGSTKGQMVITADELGSVFRAANETAANATRNGHPTLSEAQRKRLNELTPLPVDDIEIPGLSSLNMNYLNGYRPGEDHMPLQFIYEPADCRLFLTYENIVRPETAWKAAAEAFWEGGRCVNGSSSST